MARSRMIYPSIWTDREFGTLSDKSKILFLSCISNADDDGRLVANPVYLRSIAFLYDKQVTDKKVIQYKQELGKNMANIHFYEVAGQECAHLTNWETYQNQKADRRKPSTLPECPRCVGQNVSEMSPQVKLSKESKKDKFQDDKMSSTRDGMEKLRSFAKNGFKKPEDSK